MLILTRKVEEAVIIGGNIKVKVLGVGQGRVKLGFEAPDEVEILRQELVKEQADARAG